MFNQISLNDLINDAACHLSQQNHWLQSPIHRALCYGYALRQRKSLPDPTLESMPLFLTQIKKLNRTLAHASVQIEGNLTDMTTTDWLNVEAHLVQSWWCGNATVPIALSEFDVSKQPEVQALPSLSSHLHHTIWSGCSLTIGALLATGFVIGIQISPDAAGFGLIIGQVIGTVLMGLKFRQAAKTGQALITAMDTHLSPTWEDVFAHKTPADSLLVGMLTEVALSYLGRYAEAKRPALFRLSPVSAFHLLRHTAYDSSGALLQDAPNQLAAITDQYSLTIPTGTVVAGVNLSDMQAPPAITTPLITNLHH